MKCMRRIKTTMLFAMLLIAASQTSAQLPTRVESFPISSVLADGGNVAAFAVPASLQTAEVLTVKIAKGDKRITPHVYEVRLTE